MIVTTADLKVANFDPSRISLSDGTLEHSDVVDVPFLRFRKQVLARASAPTPEDYGSCLDPAYARQSTVFVVRAEAFVQFLAEFEIQDSLLRFMV